MSDIKKSTILISGAANGIGRELALMCSNLGCEKLILIDIDLQGLEKVQSKLRCPSHLVRVDLSVDIDNHPELLKLAGTEEIDIAILNAGVGGINPGDSFNEEINKKTFKINYFGTTSIISMILPKMLSREKGHIVGVASLAGLRGMPQASTYSASKAAQITFLESLRLDLKPHNIQVTTVFPGFIKTRMTNHDEFKMPFLVSVDKTAQIIIKSIIQNRRTIYFPFPLNILSILNRFLPAFIYDRIITFLNPPQKKEAKIF